MLEIELLELYFAMKQPPLSDTPDGQRDQRATLQLRRRDTVRIVSTQHIGAAGELLVQYRLLKLGIDSARMTTDAGIDLVVYAPGDRSATTIQVKANLAPKPAGGRGPMSRGWYFPHDCPAQVIALVALDVDTAGCSPSMRPSSTPSSTRRRASGRSTGESTLPPLGAPSNTRGR